MSRVNLGRLGWLVYPYGGELDRNAFPYIDELITQLADWRDQAVLERSRLESRYRRE